MSLKVILAYSRQERLGHQVPIYDTLDGKTLVPYQCVMVRALRICWSSVVKPTRMGR